MRCHVAVRAAIAAAVILAAVPAGAAVCLRNTNWGPQVAPLDQRMSLETLWRRGRRALVAIRFSPLRGEHPKLYGFYLYNGYCAVRAITVGPVPDVDGGGSAAVAYSEDYYAGRRHRRLAVSKTPPRYEAVKEDALRLLR